MSENRRVYDREPIDLRTCRYSKKLTRQSIAFISFRRFDEQTLG